MENLQLSDYNKYKKQAQCIENIILSLSYEMFTNKELEALIMLTDYIRRIPPDEINNFRLVKHSESWDIYKKLKLAYSLRKVDYEMKAQLIEYEKYEVLNELKI